MRRKLSRNKFLKLKVADFSNQKKTQNAEKRTCHLKRHRRIVDSRCIVFWAIPLMLKFLLLLMWMWMKKCFTATILLRLHEGQWGPDASTYTLNTRFHFWQLCICWPELMNKVCIFLVFDEGKIFSWRDIHCNISCIMVVEWLSVYLVLSNQNQKEIILCSFCYGPVPQTFCFFLLSAWRQFWLSSAFNHISASFSCDRESQWKCYSVDLKWVCGCFSYAHMRLRFMQIYMRIYTWNRIEKSAQCMQIHHICSYEKSTQVCHLIRKWFWKR